MPNRITPKHLKVINGSERPTIQTVDLPPVDTVPEPPDWLPSMHAVKEWHRLTPILVANKLLSTGDLSTLAHLCAVHGKLVQLWTAGETPTGHMLAQYNSLAGSFGLAPGWRSKVKPIGDKDTANPFEKHKHPAG
jgi:hypothetical protein